MNVSLLVFGTDHIFVKKLTWKVLKLAVSGFKLQRAAEERPKMWPQNWMNPTLHPQTSPFRSLSLASSVTFTCNSSTTSRWVLGLNVSCWLVTPSSYTLSLPARHFQQHALVSCHSHPAAVTPVRPVSLPGDWVCTSATQRPAIPFVYLFVCAALLCRQPVCPSRWVILSHTLKLSACISTNREVLDFTCPHVHS